MRISFAVQAVPQRRENAEAMATRLREQIASSGLDVGGVEVFYDIDLKGCWFSWCEAWKTHKAHGGVTHHVVLQDDLLLCADLPATMAALAQARPEDMISGFLPRKSVNLAVEAGLRWVRTRRFLWAQCVMMPVELGDACVKWVAEHEGTDHSKEWGNSGDMRLAGWLAAMKRPVYVAVPHPVEHIGDALEGRSVMGHNGKAEGRRARAWLGEDQLGGALNWADLRFVRE